MVAHGIAHTVVPLHAFLSGIVIVGIRKIIFPVVFVHPCSLVEIHQSLHGLHRAVYLHHVVLQPAALARAAPALVQVGLPVVVHKHAGVDNRIQTLDVSLHGEVGSRFLARGHPDFPTSVPIGLAGMGKIEIVRTVLISTVRRPHEAALLASPRHLRGAEDFSMVCPMYHIISGKHMILVHQIATASRCDVMGGIHIQASVGPDMG